MNNPNDTIFVSISKESAELLLKHLKEKTDRITKERDTIVSDLRNLKNAIRPANQQTEQAIQNEN